MSTEKSDQARWFAEEVQPHEPSLRAYLHASARSPSDVDDLLQDSYLRLLRVYANVPIRSVKSLLFAIARNAVRDAIRRRSTADEIPITESNSGGVVDQSPSVVELVNHRQQQAILAEAIRLLPQRCREVLLLRKINGLSQREIALKLGITENTVESLVSKGARRCADYVRRHRD